MIILRNIISFGVVLALPPGGSAFLLPSFSKSTQKRITAWSTPTSNTALFDFKSSDRARMEREFEESMGDDWRVFRARLVAQEQAEANEKAKDWHQQHESQKDGGPPQASSSSPSQSNPSIERQGQMFGSEISAILFHGKSPTSSERTDYLYGERKKVETITQHRARVMAEGGGSPTAGAAAAPAAAGDTTTTKECDDPFASPDELPCLKQSEESVGVNKHRWAHPISHIEEGAVMLSSEKLGGVFHQTVLLVVDHHEKTGTCAVVINRPVPGNLMELSCDMETNLEESIRDGFSESAVSYGGPVAPEAFSCIHGYGEVQGSKKIAPGVFIGGSKELLSLVKLHRFNATDAMFTQGHGAWGPGQMEEEIANGVWYPASCSPDMILRLAGAPTSDEDNLSDLWTDILTCMGGDYADIARKYGTFPNNKRLRP